MFLTNIMHRLKIILVILISVATNACDEFVYNMSLRIYLLSITHFNKFFLIVETSNFVSYLLPNTTYTCYAYHRHNRKLSSISNILLNFLKFHLCVSTYHLSNYFNFHTQILMFFFPKSAFSLKSYNL